MSEFLFPRKDLPRPWELTTERETSLVLQRTKLCPPKFTCRILDPKVMVAGDGACGRWLGLDEQMTVGTLWWHYCPSKTHQQVDTHSLSAVGASPETNQATTLILNIQSIKQWENTFLFFKSPSPWYLITIAHAKTDTERMLKWQRWDSYTCVHGRESDRSKAPYLEVHW